MSNSEISKSLFYKLAICVSIVMLLSKSFAAQPIAYKLHNSEADSLVNSTNQITHNSCKDLYWNMAGQSAAGFASGTLLALPGLVIGNELSKNSNNSDYLSSMAIGMYTGYVLGSSLGVYLMASNDSLGISPNVLLTLSSGLAGALIGVGAYYSTNQKGYTLWIPFVMPLITSVLYVNFIDNYKEQITYKTSLPYSFELNSTAFYKFRNDIDIPILTLSLK